MAQAEQVTAHNYPGESSGIVITPFDYGVMNGDFEHAVGDLGNDSSVSWPSFSTDERFTLDFAGFDERLDPEAGVYWPQWLLKFEKAEKTLRISITDAAIERFEGDTFVPGSYLDISDTFAAWFNLMEYRYQAKAQGSDPNAGKLGLMKYLFRLDDE